MPFITLLDNCFYLWLNCNTIKTKYNPEFTRSTRKLVNFLKLNKESGENYSKLKFHTLHTCTVTGNNQINTNTQARAAISCKIGAWPCHLIYLSVHASETSGISDFLLWSNTNYCHWSYHSALTKINNDGLPWYSTDSLGANAAAGL